MSYEMRTNMFGWLEGFVITVNNGVQIQNRHDSDIRGDIRLLTLGSSCSKGSHQRFPNR